MGNTGSVRKPLPPSREMSGLKKPPSNSSLRKTSSGMPPSPLLAAEEERQRQSSERQTSTESSSTSPTEAYEVQNRRFEEVYEMLERLGAGSFSVVHHCRHRVDGGSFAVKCIDLDKLVPEDKAALNNEILILNEISHPHIVQLIEVFREAHMCYLVMELVRGGELFDRIVARTCYDEVTARGIVRLLLMTVHYLHSHNVVHRDIKPENLLLMRHNDDCQVKIADFGFAEHISVLEECSAVCGTPQYVAPEILQGQRYGATVDVWSMGVVTFVLLGGYPPFYDREKKQLFRKIVRGQYEFHSPFWDHVSQEAKDFIRCMLVVDARSRRTAAQLLEHRWIRGPSAARLLPGPGGERHFRNYDARRRLRAAGFAVIAAHRLQTRAKRARAGGGGGSPATPQWRATAESRLDSDEDLENSVVAVAVPLQMGSRWAARTPLMREDNTRSYLAPLQYTDNVQIFRWNK